jgi:SET domain-containing protein
VTPSPRSSSSSPQLRRVSRSPKTRGPAARPAPPDYSRWIRVSNSGIHGKGVYAKVLIPAGTQIIEYVGEKITKAEARRREEQRLERLEAGGDGCVTIFDLNLRHDLDARGSRTPARLINHSCTPNCRSENSRGHIWVVAMRDIAIGEEITFDYGFPLSEWSRHPCRCGVPSCAGYIVAKAQRWRLRKILRQAEKSSSARTPGQSTHPSSSKKPRSRGR